MWRHFYALLIAAYSKQRGNNFRGNVGVGPDIATWVEHRDSGNGLFMELYLSRASYVTDGLSHTVAFSERLRGSGQPNHPLPEHDFWGMTADSATADETLLACRLAARPGADLHVYGRRPIMVLAGSVAHALYTHPAAQWPRARLFTPALVRSVWDGDGAELASWRSERRDGRRFWPLCHGEYRSRRLARDSAPAMAENSLTRRLAFFH